MRTCARPSPPLASVKRLANGSPARYQISAPPRYKEACARAHVQLCPTLNFCKNPGQWVFNHIPNFSAIRPAVSEIWHLHVRKCRCTPPMTCVIWVAVWSLSTCQIWSPSAQPLLSYSSAGNFDTFHATRAASQGDPSNEQTLVLRNFIE